MAVRRTAKAQVIRCADEILRRIRAGESVTAIHEDLTGRGEIAMTRRTLSNWVKRIAAEPSMVPSERTAPRSRMPAGRKLGPREGGKDESDPSDAQHDPPDLYRTGSGTVVARLGVAVPPRKRSGESPNLDRFCGSEAASER